MDPTIWEVVKLYDCMHVGYACRQVIDVLLVRGLPVSCSGRDSSSVVLLLQEDDNNNTKPQLLLVVAVVVVVESMRPEEPTRTKL